MKTKQIQTQDGAVGCIEADPGKVLVKNADTSLRASRIFLGTGDSAENYHEEDILEPAAPEGYQMPEPYPETE